MTLDELGTRICIMGPSNSGKSTLAEAIGRAQSLEVVHLDQLHHLPHTDWIPRPPEEFAALHNKAITRDRWVIKAITPGCSHDGWNERPASFFSTFPRQPACIGTFGAAGSSAIGAAL